MTSSDLLERTMVMCLCAIVLVVVILCTGCADPPPETGYVRDKSYEPAHWEGGYDTYYRSEYSCSPESVYDYNTGRTEYRPSCGYKPVSYTVWDDHDEWVEDSWRLYLEDCKVNDKGENKCKKGWRSVSDESTYDKYGVGDHYPDAQ